MIRIIGSELSISFTFPVEITTGRRNPELHYLSVNPSVRRLIQFIIRRSESGITINQCNGAKIVVSRQIVDEKPDGKFTLDGKPITSIELSKRQIRWK